MTDASQVQMLLQKIRQFPVKLQQETLELYIAHELRYDSKEEIQHFCQQLLEQETQNPGLINTVALHQALDHQLNDGEIIKRRISKKLDAIMAAYCGQNDETGDVYEKLGKLESTLDEIQARLRNTLSQSKRNANLTVPQVVNKIQNEQEHHDEAMLEAAQVMFDRVFDSINPDAAENYLDQSILQVGPLKKAALFDASKEKYTQLLEYHQSGNFIRDFKVNYKRYLRNKNS